MYPGPATSRPRHARLPQTIRWRGGDPLCPPLFARGERCGLCVLERGVDREEGFELHQLGDAADRAWAGRDDDSEAAAV
jgi:hypothetical protein